MEMNNLRVESHVAQKNRRHKLRFQQNSGDLNHQQHQQQQQQQPFSYNPNVLPSEMLTSIARNNNPHFLQGFSSHDQDHSNDSVYANLPYPQDCSNAWKPVVSSQQEVAGDHWVNNGVSYSGYGYHQDPFYHNALQQDHVTLALPPQSKNDPGMTQSFPCWMNGSDESGFLANRVSDHREQQHQQQQQQTRMVVKEGNCSTQGLSLSLSSSVPQLKDDQPGLQSGQNPLKSDLLPNSDAKSLMGVSAFAHRNTGPLGPFTGYATILKNSKYIKPAQELLSVSCEVGYQELAQTCHDAYSHKILEEEMSRASDCAVGGSYGESDEHASGRISSGSESLRPEFHRKKARLLYMQEEVCRRYKQYLQQMQMVISSFETVAGLSAATPYVCLALKAVSRHFHHVKNVISEQLSQMRKTVGEGLCSSSTVSKAFDANATSTSRIKSGGGSAGFFVPQQPVWRPQRGLPERAIAVLKTWLFDHFLHPYPSDADKHMLATQTGLTRNQVSNWFINARVRIWKPMVEEIHTLETKGLAEASSSHPQSNGQDPNWMDMSSLSNTQQPPECSRNPSVNVNLTADEPHDQLRDHEKQARAEYQIPLSGMDRLMSIMPYPRATFDATGLGPVSLTLGLRQNAEHVQQLQQHFGGQLIHDFVG
ncbi:putative transcription factor Homeodomain-TALE-BEL family [Helianthus anomalus]